APRVHPAALPKKAAFSLFLYSSKVILLFKSITPRIILFYSLYRFFPKRVDFFIFSYIMFFRVITIANC
ncbi:MAG TPA: hypothetical protein DD733_06915, partial [Clostridiales bacterium]|nr:hypothetical protein [Clostridiales bacterium]